MCAEIARHAQSHLLVGKLLPTDTEGVREWDFDFRYFSISRTRKYCWWGAGQVAVRRIRTLLLFGADITVVAREIPGGQRGEMEGFLETGKVRLRRKRLEKADITPEFLLVICAAGDPEADGIAKESCRELGIPVNIASDRSLSDFYFPAVVTGRICRWGLPGTGRITEGRPGRRP